MRAQWSEERIYQADREARAVARDGGDGGRAFAETLAELDADELEVCGRPHAGDCLPARRHVAQALRLLEHVADATEVRWLLDVALQAMGGPERIPSRHREACVDEYGKIECVCGLADLEREAVTADA